MEQPVLENRTLDVLVLPQFLSFADFPTLCILPSVSKYLSEHIRNNGHEGYWQAVCNSFSVEKKLYAIQDVFYTGGTKKFFLIRCILRETNGLDRHCQHHQLLLR